MSIQKISFNTKKFNAGIKLFGDEWTLHIIGALETEELRYCQIERALPLINPATLANRLKKLETKKLIKRKVETVDKLSVTYCLTTKGRAALPVLATLKRYANLYL